MSGRGLLRRPACLSSKQVRYLAVEPKVGRFDPAYVGQLGTYVAVVDDRPRRPDRHAPTVGILLCKSRNDTLVRYALANAPAPLAVANYTYDTLPPAERAALPPAEELAAALAAALDDPAADTPDAPGRRRRHPKPGGDSR
jgi:YhcG PDDEXK nuclease domain